MTEVGHSLQLVISARLYAGHSLIFNFRDIAESEKKYTTRMACRGDAVAETLYILYVEDTQYGTHTLPTPQLEVHWTKEV